MKLGPFAAPGYYVGDCRALLAKLPDGCIDCVVTSPPYWGLRDYGIPPAAWGGDPEHAHDFETATIETEVGGGNWTQGTNGRGEEQPGGAAAAREPVRSAATTGWCACGAWLGQLGLEPTLDLYLDNMLEVAAELWRVLRSDGTLWLNLGDSYVCAPPGNDRHDHTTRDGATVALDTRGEQSGSRRSGSARRALRVRRDNSRGYRGERLPNGRGEERNAGKTDDRDVNGPAHRAVRRLAPKNLVGAPWRTVFALQDEGWIHRGDVVWSKLNPMPEAVRDRPTRAHEYLFQLVKQGVAYYYDADAVKEPVTGGAHARGGGVNPKAKPWIGRNEDPAASAGSTSRTKAGFNERWRTKQNASFSAAVSGMVETRNKRSVWTLPSEPFAGAHFATMPTALVAPCVLASCRPGGVVLDPFMGSGTVGRVAEDLGRTWLGFDASAEYAKLARVRMAQVGLLGRTGGGT